MFKGVENVFVQRVRKMEYLWNRRQLNIRYRYDYDANELIESK